MLTRLKCRDIDPVRDILASVRALIKGSSFESKLFTDGEFTSLSLDTSKDWDSIETIIREFM